MMIDDNERLSNSICSTQRHCRWRMRKKRTSANHYMKERLRPVSIKNGVLVLAIVVLRLPLTSVKAYLISLYEHRGLQLEPISSDQPTLSANPSRSFQPSPAPSISQKPSISPSSGTSAEPSLRPTTAFPSSGMTTEESFPSTFTASGVSTICKIFGAGLILQLLSFVILKTHYLQPNRR